MTGTLAVTWWGHSSATVELGDVRLAVDPLLVDRLGHLRRRGATPRESACDADLVLVSHQHADHLHVPSLRRFGPDVVLVGPHGAERLLERAGAAEVRTVGPGDEVDVRGVAAAGAAREPPRRPPPPRAWRRRGHRLPGRGGRALLLVPRGHRAPRRHVRRTSRRPGAGADRRLGADPRATHLSPETAAEAVRRVGARHAVPVHWGTFWPVGLERVAPGNHQQLFVSPGARFVAALDRDGDPRPVLAAHGQRVELA